MRLLCPFSTHLTLDTVVTLFVASDYISNLVHKNRCVLPYKPQKKEKTVDEKKHTCSIISCQYLYSSTEEITDRLKSPTIMDRRRIIKIEAILLIYQFSANRGSFLEHV